MEIKVNPDLVAHWPQIRNIFSKSFFSSFHFAIATINADGTPHVSPIGSLILDRQQQKGFYFEIFTSHLQKNLEANPNVCVLATNSGGFFWLRSLAIGRFRVPPAVRLRGFAGARRLATNEEISRWRRRIGFLRFLPGYRLLWGNLQYVREIEFCDFEPVKMGRMTARL
jgi:hypothetical protein